MPDIKNTPEAVEAARLAAEAAVGQKALGATVGGGAVAVYGGLTLNEWAIVIGVAVAIGGFIVQLVVQGHAWQTRRAQNKRDMELHRLAREKAAHDAEWHAARMARLRAGAADGLNGARPTFSDSGETPLGD